MKNDTTLQDLKEDLEEESINKFWNVEKTLRVIRKAIAVLGILFVIDSCFMALGPILVIMGPFFLLAIIFNPLLHFTLILIDQIVHFTLNLCILFSISSMEFILTSIIMLLAGKENGKSFLVREFNYIETINQFLAEDELILWRGETKKDALKENYVSWRDLFLMIFPFIIILNVILIVTLPLLIYSLLFINVIQLKITIFVTVIVLSISITCFFSARMISLYLNRKIGRITYVITSKRIFIISRDMKETRIAYQYSTDICCKLPMVDFKSEGILAHIDQERMKKIEIRSRLKQYHADIYYEIEENDNWRFKLAGLQDISSLSKVLVEKLSFKKLETNDEHVDLFVRE